MRLEERAARLSPADIMALLQRQQALEAHNLQLQQQNEWFKRQLFGRKSERRLLMPDARQLPLAGILPAREEPADKPPPTETVKAYQRRTRFGALPEAEEAGLRFDGSVPVRVIAVPNPAVAGLAPAAYEIIGEKVTWRNSPGPTWCSSTCARSSNSSRPSRFAVHRHRRRCSRKVWRM
jgi:transposase